MSAPKLTTVYGLLGKSEASYGAGGSLSTSTDGLWIVEPVRAALAYLISGQRPMGPGTGGELPDVAARGETLSFTPRVRGRGAGAAYSSSVKARDLHVYLKAAGWADALDTATPGAEKVTYKPSSARADWASAVFGAYTDEALLGLLGWYNGVEFEIGDDGFWTFGFPGQGLVSALWSDAAVPSISYQNPTTPPIICESMAMAIGSYANVPFRRLRYRDGRVVTFGRTNFSVAGAHGGGSLGKYGPTLEVLIEQTALVGTPYHSTSGLNVHELLRRKTALAISFAAGTGGTGVYNRLEFAAAQAQLRSAEPDSAEPDALWRLTFGLPVSAPGADDSCTLVTK